MSYPTSMLPVPHDAAAGAEVRAQIAALDALLGRVMSSRAVQVSAARDGWTGPHRHRFDAADDDLHDASRVVARLLDDLRFALGRAEAGIEDENRARAHARRRWRERERERELERELERRGAR